MIDILVFMCFTKEFFLKNMGLLSKRGEKTRCLVVFVDVFNTDLHKLRNLNRSASQAS